MALKTVYNERGVEIKIDNVHKFVYFYYIGSNEDNSTAMDEDDYKAAMVFYGNLFENTDFELLLVDTRASTMLITPELQEWTAKEVAPKTISLKRMAFVLSSDIFQAVSTQQLMEEDGIADKYDAPVYFEQLEEAQYWLFEKQDGWPY